MQNANRPSLDRLKKQAKKLKTAAGISHCRALHVIACNHGYSCWKALMIDYQKAATKGAR